MKAIWIISFVLISNIIVNYNTQAALLLNKICRDIQWLCLEDI